MFTSFLYAILAVMLMPPAWSQTISEGLIIQELERAQTNPDSATQIIINAPTDYVFIFLTKRLNEYVTDVNALEFDHLGSAILGKLSVGSLRTVTMQNGDLLFQRFLVIDKPREFAYYTNMQRSTLEAPLRYSVSRYRLTELSDGRTQLDVAVTYRATSRIFAFIVQRAFSFALKRDFERAADIISNAYIAENSL